MKQYATSALALDDILRDANRHFQQLNYIVKECERRGCADSVVSIAQSCEPLYSALVRPRLAQVEQERDGLRDQLAAEVGKRVNANVERMEQSQKVSQSELERTFDDRLTDTQRGSYE